MGKVGEGLAQARNANPLVSVIGLAGFGAHEVVARVKGLKFGKLACPYGSSTIGGAVQVGIVDHHGNAISADMNVAFDHVRAVLQAPVEGHQCVLGNGPGRAPVSKDEGGWRIEVGVSHWP